MHAETGSHETPDREEAVVVDGSSPDGCDEPSLMTRPKSTPSAWSVTSTLQVSRAGAVVRTDPKATQRWFTP